MAEKVIERDIIKDAKDGFLDYAMDVICGRAFADVRDGCKPVHRRILYAMNETGNTCTKPYKKSARTVGEVLGKYHPHGDSSVYDAMVRMAQDFSLRYPLVDGHGNFGSIDGDSAAAMRYTEARMSKVADTMMDDIEKDTVNMMKNYDESLDEPAVLPAKLPNLLVNGTEGIAVGFASKMPPHNITEVVNGIIARIDDPSIDSLGLMKYIKGPDFPGGATIINTDGITSMYTTGKGTITMQADYEIESAKGGKTLIVFKTVPYQVTKSQEVAKIENLCMKHTDKKTGATIKPEIDGVADVRDETNREGVRIVLELKKNADPRRIVRKIYKSTNLRSNFNASMMALQPTANGRLRPHLFTLVELVDGYIGHRKEVVQRKYKFLLAKAEEHKHILDGLLIAVNAIDDVVKAIRQSKSKDEACTRLRQDFGLDTVQAQAVLAYRLQGLVGLEFDKLKKDMEETEKNIEKYKAILSSDKTILAEVKKDCKSLLKSYGDERLSKIVGESDDDDDDEESLVEDKEMVVSITDTGYIKSVPLSEFSAQRRGGKGVKSVKAANVDNIKQIISTNKKNFLICLGSDGRAYRLPVSSIDESGRASRGTYLYNLIEANTDVKIMSVIGVERSKIAQGYVLFFTLRGEIKKIKLEDLISKYRVVKAIILKEGDELVNAVCTYEESGLAFIATRNGKLMKFDYGGVRAKGRASSTNKGMKLVDGDYVVSADIINPVVRSEEEEADKDISILTVATNGFGKKSLESEYRLTNLGAGGVINYKTTDTIKVVGVTSINEDMDILVACDNGKVIRIHSDTFRNMGRNSIGVKLVNLANEESVVGIAPVVKEDDSSNDDTAATDAGKAEEANDKE